MIKKLFALHTHYAYLLCKRLILLQPTHKKYFTNSLPLTGMETACLRDLLNGHINFTNSLPLTGMETKVSIRTTHRIWLYKLITPNGDGNKIEVAAKICLGMTLQTHYP